MTLFPVFERVEGKIWIQFYPLGLRCNFVHDDSSSSTIVNECCFNSIAFGRLSEIFSTESLTWTSHILPLLGRSIKTSSTIIIWLMCPRRWCYHRSSMDSASTTAWVRLDVTRENLLCVPHSSTTDFCLQSQSIGFMPIILRIVFDSTSSIRLS